jgi:hypothetical protein
MFVGQKTMNSSAPGEIRTHGNRFRRPVLYPLSYGRIPPRMKCHPKAATIIAIRLEVVK